MSGVFGSLDGGAMMVKTFYGVLPRTDAFSRVRICMGVS